MYITKSFPPKKSGFSSKYCGGIEKVLQPSLPIWKCWPWLWWGLWR